MRGQIHKSTDHNLKKTRMRVQYPFNDANDATIIITFHSIARSSQSLIIRKNTQEGWEMGLRTFLHLASAIIVIRLPGIPNIINT